MITQGDTFLFFIQYCNNSTGKRNTANIALMIDILLRSHLIMHMHFSCCPQCEHTIYPVQHFTCLQHLCAAHFQGTVASLRVMVWRAG